MPSRGLTSKFTRMFTIQNTSVQDIGFEIEPTRIRHSSARPYNNYRVKYCNVFLSFCKNNVPGSHQTPGLVYLGQKCNAVCYHLHFYRVLE